MAIITVFFLGFWSDLWSIQTVVGDYDVSVRLLEFNRDQDCDCDYGFWGCHECDVYFQICLQPLSPTQGQLCQGRNSDYRVDDTHHFLFANALRGHDTYNWSSVRGQPTFEIAVHAFDYDTQYGDDDLGETNYTYRGNTPIVQTVTTIPGNKNLRIKMEIAVVIKTTTATFTTTIPTYKSTTAASKWFTSTPKLITLKPTTSIPTTTHDSTSIISRFFTTNSKPTTTECVDLHDSCAEFDLVYGFCQAPPGVSPLLYKQAHEECRRTCNFC